MLSIHFYLRGHGPSSISTPPSSICMSGSDFFHSCCSGGRRLILPVDNTSICTKGLYVGIRKVYQH